MQTASSLALLSTPLLALALGGGGTTTDSLLIGGAGSLSSEGYDDPGRLSDGVTEGSAAYVFTLDPALARLTLEVTNTSPVVPGVPNPVLTDVFFNAPSAITGMSLIGQVSSGGVAPDYSIAFDAEPGQGSDPNKAGRFGAFRVGLSDQGNIRGTIANPDADTWTVSAEHLALSPVTFTFALEGDLEGLTAEGFTSIPSVIPPGSRPSLAVAKFQAGGKNDASAFINEGGCPNEGSVEVLGSSCGGTLSATAPIPGGYSTVSYDGSTAGGMLYLLYSAPGGTPFPLAGCTVYIGPGAKVLGPFVLDGYGDYERKFPVPKTHDCGDQVVLQAFVLGSSGLRPVEISNALVVTMGS